MKEQLENFMDTARYLGDEKNENILRKLKERLEEKKLFIPIVGQYNAGKSKLINTILGRDLLPVKGIETTAYITYIEYGEDECCIEDNLGNLIPVSFEELQHIHQISIDKGTELKVVPVEAIKSIHVKVKNEFLAGGLVFIDTPGMNTLIKSHEELAYSILPEAHYLIYVFGKAAAKADLQMIKKISKLGIRIIFVRTKLDLVKANEETIEAAIDNDRSNIEKEFGSDYTYFPLTNEKALLSDTSWKDKFNDFYKYLYENVSSRISDAMESSLAERLENYRADFQKQLDEKLFLIRRLASEDEKDLQKKLDIINQQSELLERENRIVSKKVRNNIDEVTNGLKLDIARSANTSVGYFKEALEEIKEIHQLQNSTQEKAQLSLEKMVETAESCVEEQLDKLMASSFELFREKLLSIKNLLSESIDLSFNAELEMIDVEKFSEGKNWYNEKLREEIEAIHEFLQKSEKELAEYDLKKEDMEELSVQLNTYVEEVRQEIQELGVYVPKEVMIEGNTKVSEALGRIGNLADWALLLLPSTALSKGGTKIASTINKVVQGSKKGQKLAEAAGKIATTVKKTAKTMSDMDKIKDSVYVLKQIQDKAKKTGLDEKTGILDLLTLEFWFKKAGSVFDIPPTIELDRAYEAEFHNEREKLTHRYREYMSREIKQLEELDLIKTNEAKIKKEMELKEKYMQRADKQLEEQAESIRKQAEMKAKAGYIEACVGQYRTKVAELQREIQKGIELVVKEVINDLVIYSTAESENKIKKLKAEIEELLAQKQTNDKRVEEMEKCIQDYLAGLLL